MKQKKDKNWYIGMAAKVVAGFSLYFSIAFLITICDKVMSTGNNVGLAYLGLLLGVILLSIQFILTSKTFDEVFVAKNGSLISKSAKLMSGLSLFLSMGILSALEEYLVDASIVSVGMIVVILLTATQLAMIIYAVGRFVDKKTPCEAVTG